MWMTTVYVDNISPILREFCVTPIVAQDATPEQTLVFHLPIPNSEGLVIKVDTGCFLKRETPPIELRLVDSVKNHTLRTMQVSSKRGKWQERLREKLKVLYDEAKFELCWRRDHADIPPCPLCGSRTRLKHYRENSQFFWGCVRYPSCSGKVEEKNPGKSSISKSWLNIEKPIKSMIENRKKNSNWD